MWRDLASMWWSFSVLSEIWYNSTNQFLGKQIQKGAERTRGTVGIESDRYEKWR